MQPPDLTQIKAIFAEALERTGVERQAFLDEACGGDSALRAEVSAYLDAVEEAGDAMDSPRPPAQSFAGAPAQGVGSTIGHYKLVELIGQGGFGSVFMAEQQRPVRRQVALKIIKLGMDTQQVIARFEAERQALALMDHPNIARVFDAGATEAGRPYFVMELVRGVSITEYCDAHNLTTVRRLELFIAVCQAIQHAHQKGVIHRDIKPTNVLVTHQGEAAVPKVIDFGIAKATHRRLTDGALSTEAQHRVGTPAYMSPEQAAAGGLDIDTRSDIYSLGVLLYELLTGTTPFAVQQLQSRDYGETQRIIVEVDPPRPSSRLGAMGQGLARVAADRGERPNKLRQLVRGELDWIVMKALEKDRARRYQSANELLRDIRRHLSDEPIEAGPPSATYWLRKFVRRHRVAVVTAAAFLIMIAAGIATYVHGVSTERRKTAAALQDSQQRRDEAQRSSERARAAEAQANEEVVQAAVIQGSGARVSSHSGRRFDSLKLLASAARISPSAAVRSQAIACLGLADLRITQQWSSADHAVCFNHACTFYADSTPDGEVLIRPVPGPNSPPSALAIRLPGHVWKNSRLHEDSGRVVFSPDDQLVAVSHADGHVRVFRLDGQVVADVSEATACDFSPDSAAIAVCQRLGVVRIIDLKSGKEQKRLLWPGSDSIAFSPDGRKLALWNQSDSSDVLVGDIHLGNNKLLSHVAPITGVCWHPAGNMLATASEDRRVFVWDVADIERPRVFSAWGAHFAAVTSVEFNHRGNLLATASLDGTVRLWDLSCSELLVRVFCTGILRFSPDDRTLAVAAYNGRHAVVEVATGGERRSLAIAAGDRECVAFSPDGAVLACDNVGFMRFFNLTGSVANPAFWDLRFAQETRSVAFHPDGASVFISTDGGLWRVPIETQVREALPPGGAPTRQLTIGPIGQPLVSRIGNPGGRMEISRDGRFVPLAQWGRDAVIVDLQHPHDPRILPGSADCRSISISPDGKWVATGSWKGAGDGRVRIWNSRTASVVASLPISLDANVAFSPDNRWLVTATPNEFRFWEVGTWQRRHGSAMDSDVAGSIFFSPDSRLAALSSQHMGVRLMDVNTAVELATLEGEGDERPLGFSPDGGLLVTRGRFETLRLWDLRRLREELGPMGLDWSQPALPPEQARPPIAISVKEPPAP